MTLADRVVVMEKGIIQQVGTPTEIYDKPQNTFVRFIGNPAMNLIEGKVIDGSLKPNTSQSKNLRLKMAKNFRISSRRRFCNPSKGNISAPIYSVELLGDATMITICIAGVLISVKAGKNYNASIGDPIEIEVPAENCHLFDPKTKNRNRYKFPLIMFASTPR